MTLAVTILGSSGMYGTLERAASGYLVEVAGARIWIDAGGGTWRNLLQHVHYAEIDGVILTHRHPDHVIDIFQAFHARHYGGREPLDSIPLWAPQETIERITAFSSELSRAFAMTKVTAGDEVPVDGAAISFFAMAHPTETVGVRVEHGGSVLAYSADTGPTSNLRLLAKGADVFICEATLQDADPEWEGHMKASEAGTAAVDAGAAHLVLSHLPPGRDLGLTLAEAQRTCQGIAVELAGDGRRLEISR